MKRLVFALATALACACAAAQTYPARTIKIIIPFPPGGGMDGIGRPFAERISAILGQPVVIDNRAGAAGNIGAEIAARAAPDGYTLLIANDFLATNPALYKSTGYDTLKDFMPISRIGTTAIAIAVNPALPVNDLKELIALSKSRSLTFSSPGIGSVPHLVGELFRLDGVMDLVHVPYKGSSPAVTDAIGGQVNMVITTLSSIAPHARAQKLRGIAVLGANRAEVMPELPTLPESGYPNAGADIWYAMFAPGGTPAAIVTRLSDASIQALAQPELIERLRKGGYQPASSTPAALGALVKADLEKWRRVVTAAKIAPE